MNSSKWLDDRNELFLLASKERSDTGKLVVSPPRLYGKRFAITNSEEPVYDEWFRSKLNVSTAQLGIPLLIFFVLYFVSKSLPGLTEKLILLGMTALLGIGIEYFLVTFRTRSFIKSVGGVAQSAAKSNPWVAKRILIVASMFRPWVIPPQINGTFE